MDYYIYVGLVPAEKLVLNQLYIAGEESRVHVEWGRAKEAADALPNECMTSIVIYLLCGKGIDLFWIYTHI